MKRGVLYPDEALKVLLLERNLYRQYKRTVALAERWKGTPQFSSGVIKELHRIAMQDVYGCAGNFRRWQVKIDNSGHVPPRWASVPGLVEDLCERANDEDEDPLRVTAYVLWKLNWIHPFGGGNGRTSRAVASLCLFVRLGYILPGRPTLGAYVDENQARYMTALRDADAAWSKSGVADVRLMESFLNDLLREQLSSVQAPTEMPPEKESV
jgi:Fic family protein